MTEQMIGIFDGMAVTNNKAIHFLLFEVQTWTQTVRLRFLILESVWYNLILTDCQVIKAVSVYLIPFP